MFCLVKLYQSVAEFPMEFRDPKHPYQEFYNTNNKSENLTLMKVWMLILITLNHQTGDRIKKKKKKGQKAREKKDKNNNRHQIYTLQGPTFFMAITGSYKGTKFFINFLT